MADFIDHVQQAKHNLSCANTFLNLGTCRDWAITAAFYSAVHFVEAGFSTIPHIRHTSSHATRNSECQLTFGNCYRQYRKLFNASIIARYLQGANSVAGGYYTQQAASDFINQDLPHIRNVIEQQLNIDMHS